MDKTSYAIGMNLGANLRSEGISGLDLKSVMEGMDAVLNDKATAIDQREAAQILNQYFTELEKKQKEEAINKGRAFLTANGARPGVVSLKSGLQYEVLKEGTGRKPKATDTVRCHYEGKLIDGTVFDSSISRNEPADFPVNGVIAGWVEALQLMNVGSKWKLFIPYNLAYGERGAGRSIPPYSTLVFEVELLAIL